MFRRCHAPRAAKQRQGVRRHCRGQADPLGMCPGGVYFSTAESARVDRSRRSVERKIFWTSFILLSLIADFSLPLLWGLVATIPIALASWWIAYRSGWF